MSTHNYKTVGICPTEIKFDLVGETVRNIEIAGGCDGNSKGIAAIAEGMDANTLIKRLSGINCGKKSTSCPDQLAKCVMQAIQNANINK